MDVKTAIQNGDASPLRELLKEDRSRANELIRWGGLGKSCLTHPLHFISDMLFKGMLAKGKETALADALIEASADVDFQRDRNRNCSGYLAKPHSIGRRCSVRIGSLHG